MQADEAVIGMESEIHRHRGAGREAFEQAARGEGQVAPASLQPVPFQPCDMIAAGNGESGLKRFERGGQGGIGMEQGGAKVVHFSFQLFHFLAVKR
jgi:hypothetical protein